MRKALSFFAVAVALLAMAVETNAQVYPTIPANTVLGRLGSAGSGPPQAIPITRIIPSGFDSLAVGAPSATQYDVVTFADGLGKNLADTGLLNLNPNRSGEETLNGNALAIFNATASDSHRVGVWVQTTFGSLTDSSSFYTAYNLKLGDLGSPVPSGTKGGLGGYECNMDSNQSFADSSAFGGSHCFGASIAQHNGQYSQGIAITATIDTVPAPYIGLSLNLDKEVTGAEMDGIFINAPVSPSNPPYAPDWAIKLSGQFGIGVDLAGNSLVKATAIGFATTASLNTDYGITGSLSDAFYITGGGSDHGIIFTGGTLAGQTGAFFFRNNQADLTDSVVIFAGAAGVIYYKPVAISSLPAGTTGGGNIAFVNDASACTANAPPTAGGSGVFPVFFNGGGWACF